MREDERVLVANKMPGMVCEPGKAHRDDSLLNGLFALDGGRLAPALARLGESRDWGLLHRLDRLTSGLVLCALSIEAYESLRAAFEARQVRKSYLALARGELAANGEIDQPILEQVVNGMRIASIDPRGKPAVTRWRTIARRGKYALLECDLVTGRLHQIRVHLASVGAPIAGDPLYESGGKARTGGRPPDDPLLLLHAWKLVYPDPASGEPVACEAAAPRRFARFVTEHDLPLPCDVEA